MTPATTRPTITRPMASSAPAAVIDVLNGLLEAELNSVFRFMDEGTPHLSRATADVRRPLAEMVETNRRHSAQLARLIESLGGYPLPRSIRPEEQYLAFLSLKFLLPKLANEKRLTIQRYENALKSLGKTAPPDVTSLLMTHIAEHRRDAEILDRAGAEAAKRK
jgi:hypothetical protein